MDLVTPQEYVQRTGCSYQELADTCNYSYDGVKRWFMKGKHHRAYPPIVCRVLALELELKALRSQNVAR